MSVKAFQFGKAVEIADSTVVPRAVIIIADLIDTQFDPKGILIGSSTDSTEQSEGYGTVRGVLAGESDAQVKSWPIPLRQCFPLAFKKIYGDGTTARGIKIGDE